MVNFMLGIIFFLFFIGLVLFGSFVYKKSIKEFVTPTKDRIKITMSYLEIKTTHESMPGLSVTLNRYTKKITVDFKGNKSTTKILQPSGNIGPYVKYSYHPSPTFNHIIFLFVKDEDGEFIPAIFFTSQNNTFDQVTFAPDGQTRYDANEDGSYVYNGKKIFGAKIGMQDYYIVNIKREILFKRYYGIFTDEIVYNDQSYTFTFKNDNHFIFTQSNAETNKKFTKKIKIDNHNVDNGVIKITDDILYRTDGLVTICDQYGIFLNPKIILKRTHFNSLIQENQKIDHAVVCIIDSDSTLSIPVEGVIRHYKKEQYHIRKDQN